MQNQTWQKAGARYLEYFDSAGDLSRRRLLDDLMLREISPSGKSVLDAGCGQGYFCGKLLSAGAREVVGMDISEELIREAKRHFPDAEFLARDMTKPVSGFEGRFDAVAANMALMDAADLGAAFQSMASWLRPGGLLAASITNPYYCHPAGAWKRDLRGVLMGDFEPKLTIGNYFEEREVTKPLGTLGKFTHYHRPFSRYINDAARAGLSVRSMREPRPEAAPAFQKNVPLYIVLTYAKDHTTGV